MIKDACAFVDVDGLSRHSQGGQLLSGMDNSEEEGDPDQEPDNHHHADIGGFCLYFVILISLYHIDLYLVVSTHT